jgi:excisionase family DNA binding protein
MTSIAEQPIIQPKWYTTKQVAEMLGYSLTKTKHMILSGQIRSIKDGGNRRILPEFVDDYIVTRRRKPAHEQTP